MGENGMHIPDGSSSPAKGPMEEAAWRRRAAMLRIWPELVVMHIPDAHRRLQDVNNLSY